MGTGEFDSEEIWCDYRILTPKEGRRILESLPWGRPEPGSRYQAVEFETANRPLDYNGMLRFMRDNLVLSVYDGSVDGTEYVSVPRQGADFDRYVRDLIAESVRHLHKPVVDARCGVHIHTDASDLSVSAVLQTVQIWTLVQDSAFKHLVGKHRQGTGFANRVDVEAYDEPESWLHACSESRYYAWSCSPWEERGSIEFRAPGWTNVHRSWWSSPRSTVRAAELMARYVLSCARVAHAIVDVASNDEKFVKFLLSVPHGGRRFDDDAMRLLTLCDVAGLPHPEFGLFDDLVNPSEEYFRRVSGW